MRIIYMCLWRVADNINSNILMVVDAFMRWPIIIFHIASQNSKNKKKTKRSLGLLSPVSVYTMAVTVCVYECCWARCTPHEIGIVHIEGTWRRYIPFRISDPYTDHIYVYKYSYMMHKLVTYIGIYLCYCIYRQHRRTTSRVNAHRARGMQYM